MATPFIGEIRTFAGNFAPVGWNLCDGSVLQIAQNTSLFALIGTTYGGDGASTFAVPDLRGRVPIHIGPANPLGAAAGSETVVLAPAELPAHTHTVSVSSAAGTTGNPKGNFLAGAAIAEAKPVDNIYETNAPGAQMNAAAVAPAGTGKGHANMQPFLVVTYIIATAGIYPSQ